MRNALMLIIPLLILNACSLFGPEYHQPKVEAPEDWSSHNSQMELSQQSLPELAWWKKFDDPTLNRLIRQALRHNNQIQVAIGNILQARADLQHVDYSWLPTAGLGGLGGYGGHFATSATNKTGVNLLNNIDVPSSGQVSSINGGFTADYSLNIMRQIKAGELAGQGIVMQQAARNAVRLAVISEVAGSYFSLLGMQKQLVLQQRILDDATALRHYLRIQHQQGRISTMAVTGINQYIASVKARLPGIRHNITRLQNALRVLTNRNPGRITTPNHFDNIATSGVIPGTLPSRLLQTRPDVAIAEQRLKMANTRIALKASAFFPSLDLFSLAGGGAGELSSLFALSTGFWGVGAGAGMPVLDMGVLAKKDKARGQYYAAFYNYMKTVRTAFADVDNRLSRNETARQHALQQQHALKNARKQHRLMTIQYKHGAISYARTLAARLNVDYMRANANKAKMKQIDSIVHLYQALGSGYKAGKDTPVKPFHDDHDI